MKHIKCLKDSILINRSPEDASNAGEATTNDTSDGGGIPSSCTLIFIALLGLVVCIIFCRGGGKDSNLSVLEEAKALMVKRCSVF